MFRLQFLDLQKVHAQKENLLVSDNQMALFLSLV